MVSQKNSPGDILEVRGEKMSQKPCLFFKLFQCIIYIFDLL